MRRLFLFLVGLLVLTGCGLATSEAPQVTRQEAARSATIPPNSVKVVAVGDIACPPGSPVTASTCQHAATARLAVRINPKVVLALGDLQYQTGSYSEFLGSYDRTWGALKGRTRPVPGNHEYKTPGAAGYYRYTGRKPPGYYATNIGSWRVYLLNSNCDRIDCARERAWLRADLEANPRRCSAIAMHHARFSSGLEHGSDPSMAGFWRIADNHGVDLALAGHDHDYERFRRLDADGHLTSRGMVSFVAGMGGKSHYHRGELAPGSAYFNGRAFGVLVLHLGDGGFAWRFRTTQGDVRDKGIASCN